MTRPGRGVHADGRSEHEMVQAMHAECVQELRDAKNELMHFREVVGDGGD